MGDATGLIVNELLQKNFLACEPSTSILEAAQRMQDMQCSSIVVMSKGQPVGIWTEADSLKVRIDGDNSARDIPIVDVMSAPVKTIPDHLSVNEVGGKFQQDSVRHYVVISSTGEALGVVSQSDIIRHTGIEFYLHHRRVDSVQMISPVQIPGNKMVSEAAREMALMKRSAVVVLGTDAKPIGVFTERDMLRLAASDCGDVPLAEAATKPLFSVPEDESLYHARRVLQRNGIRHLGVTDSSGQFTGLLSYKDLLQNIEYEYVRPLQAALLQRVEDLRTSEQSLHLATSVIDAAAEAIFVTDVDSRILFVNPAFTRVTGYDPTDVEGRTPGILRSGDHDAGFYRAMWRSILSTGTWKGEIWNRRKNGDVYPELLSITTIYDDQERPTNYVATFNDITDRKRHEEQIINLAYYDSLTGLPNRRLFHDRVSYTLANAHRHQHRVALFFIDLDDFKKVNDRLGHEAGDAVLREVANRLAGCMREGDSVARLSGDEFTVLIQELDEDCELDRLGGRILESISEPISIEHQELSVSASIGISVYPDDGDCLDVLIKNADVAMYYAKEEGRQRCKRYSSKMDISCSETLEIEGFLRGALQRKEMSVLYQPQVRLEDARVVCFDAVPVWHNPYLGVVEPAVFLPLAREIGLGSPFEEWFIGEVCEQLVRWQGEGMNSIPVAVRLPAQSLLGDDFIGLIEENLSSRGINPRLLELNISDAMEVINSETAREAMTALANFGVGISFDDFDSGFGSLEFLTSLPSCRLRIRSQVLKDVPKNEESTRVISAVISMAHELGLDVVAQGVENEKQIAFLRDQGCTAAQGFWFGDAVSPGEVKECFLHSCMCCSGAAR